MRISAKAEYACLAMGELAIRHERRMPVSLKTIAEMYELSHPFLMQIFHQLRGAKLVQSVRGSAGGYQLARDPKHISLREIVEQIDGPAPTASAIEQLPSRPMNVALRLVWQELTVAEQRILEGVSLLDLAQRCDVESEADYQI